MLARCRFKFHTLSLSFSNHSRPFLEERFFCALNPLHNSSNSRNFHSNNCCLDWIRNQTSRRAEIFKVSRPMTILDEEIINQEIPNPDFTPTEQNFTKEVYSAVDAKIEACDSRIFAIVHLAGKQFKVTSEDLVMIKTPLFGCDVGNRIRLDKVLLVGSSNFSIIGRPLLDHRSTVYVEALVIEKTLEHPKLWFQFHRRRRHRKMRVFQDNMAVLRITDIKVNRLAICDDQVKTDGNDVIT